MIASGTDALEQALAVYRAPGRLPQLLNRPLPDSILRLLRIAAGDADALASAGQATGESASTLIDAAILYIQQVLFADDADSYRLLGVRPDAPENQVKEHYRWLMRWLHPDRHPDRWEVAYSDRVNRAWQTLRSADHRGAYDLSLKNVRPEIYNQASQAQQLRRNALVVGGQPFLSTQVTRRLPHIVLGGLAVGAMLVLGLLYYLREEAPIAEPVAQESRAEQITALPAPELARPPSDAATPNPLRILPAAVVPMAAAKPPVMLPAAIPMPPSPPASRVADGPTLKPPVAQPPVKVAMTEASSGAVAAIKTDVSNRRGRRNAAQSAAIAGSHSVLVANSSLSAAVAPPLQAVSGKPVAESPQAAANALSQSFIHAYAAGDLVAMMGLFSVDAVDNRGGVEAIAQDYDKLFRATQTRDLQLERLAWTMDDDRMTGSGPFEAILRRRGESTDQHVQGWMTIQAKFVDGHWRIQRLVHRNAR